MLYYKKGSSGEGIDRYSVERSLKPTATPIVACGQELYYSCRHTAK